MLTKGNENRVQSEIICIDDLVPKEHLLRKIDAAVDFRKIYDIVKDLYCKDNGRPSTDPVVLFKIAIILSAFSGRTSSFFCAEKELFSRCGV